MAQSPRINVTQTQRLQLNTALQASISLLRADAAGLTRYLEEQAAENPHLQLSPPPPPLPGEWLPRWSRVLRGPEHWDRDEIQAPPPGLMAHVLTQIMAQIPPGTARQIALVLAEALEPSGWLGRSLKDLAREAGAGEAETLVVLQQLQGLEPAGLFARDLAECLRLQLVEAGALDRVMERMLAHLDLLAQGAHEKLARLCGTDAPDVARRFRLIRGLDPKPGAQFAPFAAAGLREPDLLARPIPGPLPGNGAGPAQNLGWEISLNRSALPALEVRRAAAGSSEALASARALHRSLQARNSTLLLVGREILLRQSRALDEGPAALLPMRMADLAEALDLHVSTISRVVAGTSVDTPRGTWWLRALFSRAVGVPARRPAVEEEDDAGYGAAHFGGIGQGYFYRGAGQGGSGQAEEAEAEAAPPASTAALRDALARLVAGEDVSAPFSDAALAELLAAAGLPLARRTVAKYRFMLHIPPAHRRRRRG